MVKIDSVPGRSVAVLALSVLEPPAHVVALVVAGIEPAPNQLYIPALVVAAAVAAMVVVVVVVEFG